MEACFFFLLKSPSAGSFNSYAPSECALFHPGENWMFQQLNVPSDSQEKRNVPVMFILYLTIESLFCRSDATKAFEIMEQISTKDVRKAFLL